MTTSRTTEGSPSRCPICGKNVWIGPRDESGEATCPHCGQLLRIDEASHDASRALSELGVQIETDDEGQVRRVTFDGPTYDDSAIPKMALIDADEIDVSRTSLTLAGVRRLRALLPTTNIVH